MGHREASGRHREFTIGVRPIAEAVPNRVVMNADQILWALSGLLVAALLATI